MRHPSMTTRSTRIAFAVAVVIALVLPKHSPCGYPGEDCRALRRDGRLCSSEEVEPFGVFLVEYLVRSDLPIRYAREVSCE